MTKDTRIPYGARCTWWDSIDKVGVRQGLPVCPQCGNVLFEVESEEVWFAGVDRYEAQGNSGYRAMVEWSRGKCFPNHRALQAAYEAREVK